MFKKILGILCELHDCQKIIKNLYKIIDKYNTMSSNYSNSNANSYEFHINLWNEFTIYNKENGIKVSCILLILNNFISLLSS